MNDIPYLEPLLFYLQKDETLKSYFTDKSFFMPKHTLVEATEEAMKKDCPAPRALWILPENTNAITPKSGCMVTGNHTFNIIVFVQCLRDTFQLSKGNDGKIKLTGQYMELAEIRMAVKKVMNNFAKETQRKFMETRYSDIAWLRDINLYADENNFLTTALQYSVKIN